MKNIIKEFYEKYKNLIWLIGVSIIGLLIIVSLMGLFIINKPEAVIGFIETSSITKEILPFTLLSILGMIFGIITIALVVIMTIKMILPNTKAFNSLLMKDEANFLLDLPKRIRKEVFKNGE